MPKDKNEVNTSGKATFYAVLYADFRKAAMDCGYGLSLHGSMITDMDLIAVPWVADVKPVSELVARISDCIGRTVWSERHQMLQETRPHGRQIYTLTIMGDFTVDLSVMPPDSSPWIEASMPPLTPELVIVLRSSGEIIMGRYANEWLMYHPFTYDSGNPVYEKSDPITHWMSLPKPPSNSL